MATSFDPGIDGRGVGDIWPWTVKQFVPIWRPMRFLLVLLAMLSGLSLGDVAMASSPAQVVGQAGHVAAQAAPAAQECPVRARVARAAVRLDRTPPLAPHAAIFVRPCGVTIADQPLE